MVYGVQGDQARCSINILHPIAIRIHPPIMLAPLLKREPADLPIRTPRIENKEHTIPIIIAGKIIGLLRMKRLNPTARASILVAIEKKNSMNPFEGSLVIFSSCLHNESKIILRPMTERMINAIQ